MNDGAPYTTAQDEAKNVTRKQSVSAASTREQEGD